MSWQRVCDASEVAEGCGIEVIVDGQVIAVFRSEGAIYAIDGMCAHQGGPLARGRVANGCVTCPWHGWQYLMASGTNAATGKVMLRTYPTRDDGLSIFLDV